jgi:hypothetical protein
MQNDPTYCNHGICRTVRRIVSEWIEQVWVVVCACVRARYLTPQLISRVVQRRCRLVQCTTPTGDRKTRSKPNPTWVDPGWQLIACAWH